MEAGYDYLLLRGRLQRKLLKYTGIFAFVFGILLLAAGGAYYGYAGNARAGLDDLNVVLPGAVTEPAQEPMALSDGDRSDPDSTEAGAPYVEEQDGGPREAPGLAKVLPSIPATAIGSRQLYPGEALVAGSWSNPWSYEPLSYREQVLLQGFIPIEPGQAPPGDGLAAATRLIVPSIDIDSSVQELAVLDLGGSRAYETPSNTVGHIPETADGGETGSSWFFGHTDSPTLGEGSVFFDLRKVPEKLSEGEDVFIITDNGQQQYLYRATSSQVVHQDDLRLYDTGEATIQLVACVPRFVYDHRLIITGELVAQKSTS